MFMLLAKEAWNAITARFAKWRREQQAYAELAALDDRSLADIGITRGEIPYIVSQGKERPPAPARAACGSYRHA